MGSHLPKMAGVYHLSQNSSCETRNTLSSDIQGGLNYFISAVKGPVRVSWNPVAFYPRLMCRPVSNYHNHVEVFLRYLILYALGMCGHHIGNSGIWDYNIVAIMESGTLKLVVLQYRTRICSAILKSGAMILNW